MRKFTLALFIISLTVIYSCDCIQSVHGVVIGSTSGSPVDSVNVSRYYKGEVVFYGLNNDTHTSEDGYFEFNGMTGGIFRCPRLELYFERDGYSVVKKFPSCCTTNDTIYIDGL